MKNVLDRVVLSRTLPEISDPGVVSLEPVTVSLEPVTTVSDFTVGVHQLAYSQDAKHGCASLKKRHTVNVFSL